MRTLLVIFVVALASAICAAADAAPTGSVSRYVRYSFTLRNTTGALVSNAELRVFAPVLTTAYQVCTAVTASHAFDREIEADGNQMLRFAFSNLPPYAVKRIAVEATVELRATPQPVPGGDPAAFLAPDSLTDFTSPEFAKVPALDGTARSQQVARITAWVRKALKQGQYTAAPRGAAAALKSGEGDCTEFMYLVMALCRRAGIPARGASGFVCPKNATLQPAMLHDWVLWHDGGVWHLADAYEKESAVQPANYVMTRLQGAESGAAIYRCHGTGITVIMNSTE